MLCNLLGTPTEMVPRKHYQQRLEIYKSRSNWLEPSFSKQKKCSIGISLKKAFLEVTGDLFLESFR